MALDFYGNDCDILLRKSGEMSMRIKRLRARAIKITP